MAIALTGFHPLDGKVRGVFGGPSARILHWRDRSKKQFAEAVARCTAGGMTQAQIGTRPVLRRLLVYLEIEYRRVDCRFAAK